MAAPLILVQIVQVRVLATELRRLCRRITRMTLLPACRGHNRTLARSENRGEPDDRIHTDTAVIVLGAGGGTRMRSDVPKVLHTLAGRSMLAHALHAVAKVAPQHLVVVVGHDREQDRARPSRTWPTTSAAPSRWPSRRTAGHRPRRAVRADRAARRISPARSWSLPPTCRCWTATRWPASSRRHRSYAGRGHGADHHAGRPDGYGRIRARRTGEVVGIVEHADATPEQRRSARSTPASTRSTSPRCAHVGQAEHRQRPARALPDRRGDDRRDGTG